ncbi:MAG: hypothetical protein H0T86_04795, partial [Gemmatimonadales bacterium]|nr:hypothetical protein [Gemmatimonadales bacterium]
SDGGVVGFVGEFAAAVIQPSQAGALTMRLDSLHMGVYSGIGAIFGVVSGATIPAEYFATVANGVDSFQVVVALAPTQFAGNSAVAASNEGIDSASAFFEALTVDPTTAANFEGAPPFRLQGQATVRLPPGQYNGGWGVGSRFGDFGTPTTSIYNGARWFDGPSPTTNETVADPNLNNCVANAGGSTSLLTAVECGAAFTNFNNAGGLTGVTTINQAHAYIGLNGQWRNLDWIFPTAHRAADMNVYWGAGGAVDSVIDVSHNVVVPFQPYMGGGWGILNTVAGSDVDTRPTVGTVVDIGCVEPFATGNLAVEASLRIPCTSGVPVALSSTAQLGAVAFIRNVPDAPLNPPDANPGFIFYVAGSVFTMAMPALPAAGTVWALRSYAGQIIGTPGAYEFTPPPVRPFTALGATAALEFGVSSVVAAAVNSDLTNVHTVPDPYYVRSAYEASTDQKVLKFVGLPQDAIVRIYSASGVLVRMLEHRGGQYSSTSASQGSEVNWDLRNRNNQVVASGVYFYHVEAGDARRVGRFTVVNFAQ